MTARLPLILACFAVWHVGGSRLLAVGDLHGDYPKAVEILQEMGVLEGEGTWIGGADHVVQLGDVTDRGDGSGEIIELFERLKPLAEEAGGLVVTLMGNHELLNLQGQLSYVHPDETAKHGSAAARKAAYTAEGAYGSIISQYPALYAERGNLFVHAGLTPEYAQHPLEEINNRVSQAVNGKNWKSRYLGPSGPLWTRSMVTSSMAGDCMEVDKTLSLINSHRDEHSAIVRLVVGHTIQRGGAVKSLCNGRLIAADVALSTFIARNDYLSYVDLTSGEPVVKERKEAAAASGEEL